MSAVGQCGRPDVVAGRAEPGEPVVFRQGRDPQVRRRLQEAPSKVFPDDPSKEYEVSGAAAAVERRAAAAVYVRGEVDLDKAPRQLTEPTA
ncbi:hypothetical protein PMKS-003431 [Pichia membranifaciens]|uniref:Uncharacterized protein n=1 Tax=Pichia membranifaciens TaxID=4926 RepID=A0A1Q2YK76_9ASCO|nr:hypothetical protein PMKS-003431 [Pichia membranifaciens]